MSAKRTDYQKLQAELDAILAKLQSADLDVDEAVQAYDRGMQIAAELEAYLEQAQNKVTKVKAAWDARAKDR